MRRQRPRAECPYPTAQDGRAGNDGIGLGTRFLLISSDSSQNQLFFFFLYFMLSVIIYLVAYYNTYYYLLESFYRGIKLRVGAYCRLKRFENLQPAVVGIVAACSRGCGEMTQISTILCFTIIITNRFCFHRQAVIY